MYLALARKYRPQNFSEVIGEDPILKTLTHAITQNRIHHAYLFCGARGVGKTSLARIFAKSLNCEQGPTPEPCQKCEACIAITQGRSLDVLEIDAASNTGVDNIRELREQVKYIPASRYKIYIIDEVHMLSTSAFNALLKTLEEPPAHVIFILATTEPHEIPITILSRCQRYDLRKHSLKLLVQHLQNILKQEKVKATDEAIYLIAECAQGSARDAMSLLDQMMGAGSELIEEKQVRELLGLGERLLLQDLFRHLILGNLQESLNLLNQVDAQGLDLKILAEDLLHYFRHVILKKSTGSLPQEVSPSEKDFLTSVGETIDLSLLLAQYQVLWQGLREMAVSDFQKTALEITFVKMGQAAQLIDLTELVADLKSRKIKKTMVADSTASLPKPEPAKAKAPQATQQLSQTLQQAGDWYELVRWAKKVKPPVGNCLSDAVPISYSDKRIEIGFPEQSASGRMIIERKPVVEELFETHFGKKIEFVVSTLDEQKKKP